MAEIKNKNEVKEYATDEAGMMADAKAYARDDFRTVEPLVARLDGVDKLSDERRKEVAEALIQVKYDAIRAKRIGVDSLFS